MRAAAQVAYGDVDARCPECVDVPTLREEWGCDAPAEDPVFWVTCPSCDGGKRDCETCGGRGRKYLFRCPARVLWSGAGRFVDAYGWYERGMLPVDGGVSAQPALLMRAFKVFGREVQEIRANRERRAKELRKRGGS